MRAPRALTLIDTAIRVPPRIEYFKAFQSWLRFQPLLSACKAHVLDYLRDFHAGFSDHRSWYCCLPNFGRCQALLRLVDQLYSSKLQERFRSRCSCKPVSGSSDWFKVRIGRIFQNIFMSTSGRWHVITTAVLLGAHLARMHSLTCSMSFPMRVSRTGSAVRCASFLDLAPKRSQH